MTDFFANFLNPEKRLFIGYLISAAFIAIVWLRIVQKKPLINIISGFLIPKFGFLDQLLQTIS
jgi:predicted small integral membrane protein